MKTRRKKSARPGRRKKATAGRARASCAANLEAQLDERTRERDEALERETPASFCALFRYRPARLHICLQAR
jgi:hypothetical protein